LPRSGGGIASRCWGAGRRQLLPGISFRATKAELIQGSLFLLVTL